ncbi:unnamed protein product [Hymenolepis diminuta]|uniref:Uncharacterized protein n=1 Tax=Hymenolepis diminuta TaxID=6216 RepID=A0A0R3ST03_HYMDI|nr:unnamed protein product [Hymenolepis diminuta]
MKMKHFCYSATSVSTKIDRVASINDMNNYLDLLYEDISEQLQSTALILQPARNPNNLNEIYQNEILLEALARILRREWEKFGKHIFGLPNGISAALEDILDDIPDSVSVNDSLLRLNMILCREPGATEGFTRKSDNQLNSNRWADTLR